ncbi:MAG: Uma2 family endonuclease [Acidobacteriota bacterium]
MTTTEYLRTPEMLTPHELIYGELRVAEAPTVRHQRLVGDLFKALDAHVQASGLGEVILAPVDVILDSRRHLIVQPDLVFVSARRASIVHDCIWGAPDLVIEVLSPRPRIGDLGERLSWFAEHGVTEAWLVHQIDRSVQVLCLERAGNVKRRTFARADPLVSVVLPDFGRSLASISRW